MARLFPTFRPDPAATAQPFAAGPLRLPSPDTIVLIGAATEDGQAARRVLQSLGFEVLIGPQGVDPQEVPVIAVPVSGLASSDLRERLRLAARACPGAPLFAITGLSPRAIPDTDWPEGEDAAVRLAKSGLGHFFLMEAEHAVHHA